MPKIQFTIDSATGKLEVEIKGIAGPACDDVARLVGDFLGTPVRDQNTPEFSLRPQIRQRVRRKPER